MAKRTRIIEGTWDCTSCESKGVLGRHKTCPGCGNPREADGESNFDFGATNASGRSARAGVEDAEAKELAAAGADWHCGACDAANRGDAESCRTCSAPRTDAAPPRPRAGGPTASASPGRPPPVPGAASSVRRKGAPLAGCAIFLLLLGCCGFCLMGGWWGAQTRTYDGTVSAMTWKRTLARETFTPVVKTGWRDELVPVAAMMPVAGVGGTAGVEDIRSCVRAQRTTRKIPDGTERVCRTKSRRVKSGTKETCTRKDLGNGFSEETCEDVPTYRNEDYEACADETRYRSEPVYGESCTYTSWAWQSAGAPVEAAGTDASPRWPVAPIGPLDRVTSSEKYAVTWSWTQGGEVRSHTEEPATEAEFVQWRPGQAVELVVSNVGEVKEKHPR